jgi:hypothetical protein
VYEGLDDCDVGDFSNIFDPVIPVVSMMSVMYGISLMIVTSVMHCIILYT